MKKLERIYYILIATVENMRSEKNILYSSETAFQDRERLGERERG